MQIVGSTFWELLRLVCAERDCLTKLKSSIAETLLAFRSPVPPLRRRRLYCQASNVRMIWHSQNDNGYTSGGRNQSVFDLGRESDQCQLAQRHARPRGARRLWVTAGARRGYFRLPRLPVLGSGKRSSRRIAKARPNQ